MAHNTHSIRQICFAGMSLWHVCSGVDFAGRCRTRGQALHVLTTQAFAMLALCILLLFIVLI